MNTSKLILILAALSAAAFTTSASAQNYHGHGSGSSYYQGQIDDLERGIQQFEQVISEASNDYYAAINGMNRARDFAAQAEYRRAAMAAQQRAAQAQGNIADNRNAISGYEAQKAKAERQEQEAEARRRAEEEASRRELEEINRRKAQRDAEEAAQRQRDAEEARRLNEENQRRRLQQVLRGYQGSSGHTLR